MKQAQIYISIGELIDRITIAEIKTRRIEDIDKLVTVNRDYNYLLSILDEALGLNTVTFLDLLELYTTLQTKSSQIKKEERESIRKNIRDQFAAHSMSENCIQFFNLFLELKDLNETLWEIEDELRKREKEKVYDQYFIKLARGVYVSNDKRFQLKQKINSICKCDNSEVKEYRKY